MGQHDRAGERGWALIAVLGTLLVLSVIAAGLTSLSLTSVRLSKTGRAQLEAAVIGDAAINRAIVGLLDPRVEYRWRVDGVPQTFEFDGVAVEVRIQDELGKIDLNAADGDVLARLLQIVGGLDGDAARALADKIMDWREADDLRRLNGATRADYAAAGFDYTPRQGPFQSVDELKLVMDMTAEVFARVAPALTVYSKRPNVDPQTAPREVLLALPGTDATRAYDTLEQRRAGIRPAIGPSVFARAGVIDPAIPFGGRSFTITVTLEHKGRRHESAATVMLTGDPRRPYLAQAWTD